MSKKEKKKKILIIIDSEKGHYSLFLLRKAITTNDISLLNSNYTSKIEENKSY